MTTCLFARNSRYYFSQVQCSQLAEYPLKVLQSTMCCYIGSRSLLLFAACLLAFSTSKAQVFMLGFGEDDYSTREAPQSAISVSISVQGQINEDVTVTVIPVTFEQFRSQIGSIPSDIRLLENVDTAEETDFNNNIISTTITAGSGTADRPVSIEIYDDNIQEQEEAFLLYMEVSTTSTSQQIEITRNVTVLRIRDNDNVVIHFGGSVFPRQSIPEDAGVLNDSLYIIRDGETEKTLTIQLQFSGFEATIGLDLAVNETFVLDPQNDRVAVPIAILDDALPEYDEGFELAIRSSTSDYTLQQQSKFVTLTINDNDALVVGFDNQTSATANVQEGTSLQFCVAILEPEQVARDVLLTILTLPGNATENYYQLLDSSGRVSTGGSASIILENVLRESCVEVMAVEDEKLEWSRNFIVKLESADPSVLDVVSSTQVTVLITDNDGTPSSPMLLRDKLGLENGKDLYFEWTVEEDVRRPVDGFFGSIKPFQGENTNPISRRQATTGEWQFTTTNTYFRIPNIIDQEKELVLQVCSRNEFGFNCSVPVRFLPSDLLPVPDVTPAATPPPGGVLPPSGTGLEPGIIAVIIIVVLVFLLVFCCLLFLLICLLRPSLGLGGDSYFPSKIEKKKSQQYEEYRDERSPSFDSESDDEKKPV